MLALRPHSTNSIKAKRKQENAHPETELLVARELYCRQTNQFSKMLTSHVTGATRGKGTLDHLYSTHRDVYKVLPRPTFGKSPPDSFLQTKTKAGSTSDSLNMDVVRQRGCCATELFC